MRDSVYRGAEPYPDESDVVYCKKIFYAGKGT